MNGKPVILSDTHKFIFIHIGKTGGTSVEKVLCAHLDIDFETTKKSPSGEWWKHAWAKGMRGRVGASTWNDYFTFAFVRNPFDMILSLYSMYTQYPEYCDRTQHPNLYHPWNQYESFEDFILSMGHRKHEPDRLWRLQLDELGAGDQMQVWDSLKNLQTSYLTDSWKGMRGPGRILVDFVGRYEHLQQDFYHVCDRLSLPRLDLIAHGATKHVPFRELYTAKMEEVVREHFAIDIARFEYSLGDQ